MLDNSHLTIRVIENKPTHDVIYSLIEAPDGTIYVGLCGETGKDLLAEKAGGRSWPCAYAGESLYAGFPHLYFYADTRIAERFVSACQKFMENNNFEKI